LSNGRHLVFLLSMLGAFFALMLEPADAQINRLSPTERANVQLVISNLDGLIHSSQALVPALAGDPQTAAQQQIERMSNVLVNLRAKFDGNRIKSVPGLKTGRPPKYKQDGQKPSSPTAAYCDDETYVLVNGHPVKCDEGDIIVDSGVLDPNQGQPIDETTTNGWAQKWRLLHILVHEKMHEVFITEQQAELKKRPWWRSKTLEQQTNALHEAKEKATTAEKHAEVYEWQKQVLRWEIKVLDQRLKELKRRDPPDQQAIAILTYKLSWLTNEISGLEKKMAKATASDEFVDALQHWPGGTQNGLVCFYVTSPGDCWRLDVALQAGQIQRCSIAETYWLGGLEPEEPLEGTPAYSVVLSEAVFSGIYCQPDLHDYLTWAAAQGQLPAAKTGAELQPLLAANAQAVADHNATATDQGLYQTISFDTDQGRINVNLPKEDSDTLTGTVEVVPKSDASSDTLNGMVVGVQTNGQTAQTGKVAAGMLTAAGVGGGVLALVLLDSGGNEVARKTVERKPVRPPPTDYTLPHLGRPGKTVEVTGPTTGRHEAEELLVGDKPAAFITESTAGSVWRVPADVPPGPTTLKLEEAGQEHSDQFNVVRLRLSAPTTTLPQGGHTEVTTTIEGLEGMDLKRHPVSVRLTIGDPSVVRFTGKGAGGVLTQPVRPDQVKNGAYSIHSRVQAVRDGGFQIVGDVTETEPTE